MSTDENNETPLSDDDLDDVSGGFAKPPMPGEDSNFINPQPLPPSRPDFINPQPLPPRH